MRSRRDFCRINGMYIFVFLFSASLVTAGEIYKTDKDSGSVTGCWMSVQTASPESIADSIYNTQFYYVQFSMCLDEYSNVEINRKVKFDCCNEENKRYKGTYRLEDDILIIQTEDPAITEKYKFRVDSDRLFLEPVKQSVFSEDLEKILMLKQNWRRY